MATATTCFILTGRAKEAGSSTPTRSAPPISAGQEEFDRYWDALLADGGTPAPTAGSWTGSACGGASCPSSRCRFQRAASDPEAMARVAHAAFSMQRIVIADLEAALKG